MYVNSGYYQLHKHQSTPLEKGASLTFLFISPFFLVKFLKCLYFDQIVILQLLGEKLYICNQLLKIIYHKFKYFQLFLFFSFPIDKKLLEDHFLEGLTFDQCVNNDKIFFVDYKDFVGYKTKEGDMVKNNTLLYYWTILFYFSAFKTSYKFINPILLKLIMYSYLEETKRICRSKSISKLPTFNLRYS